MKNIEFTYQHFSIKAIKQKAFLVLIACAFVACKEKTRTNSNSIAKTDLVAPISMRGLQERDYASTLTFEKELVGTSEYSSKLFSYISDNLKVYTLVTIPKSRRPKEGFPILIFGHGFHPEPKKYGVSTKTGKNWRPGDYYRGIPEAYTENGFLVITPDYRGHNISEGFEYTKTSYLASTYYAIDVLNLVSALNQLEDGNQNELFYLGHSMGGDVGLKTLLVSKQIKAASLWAGVSASSQEQALYYGKLYDKENDKTTTTSLNGYMNDLNMAISSLGFDYEIESGDAVNYIQDINTPLILHHARWETSVPYQWSESLAAILYENKKAFEHYAYDSNNHLLKDENRESAIQRDIEFFNKIKAVKINKNGS